MISIRYCAYYHRPGGGTYIWFGAVDVEWPLHRDPVYCLNPILLTAIEYRSRFINCR